MATFDDFILWPAREVVLLAELTPGFILDGFTAVGGATPNVYQISLPKFVQADLFNGGIFRKCVGVQQNATALTERASLTLVNSNAGSYYWDQAAELLYVRTTDTVDPDDHVMQALVTFYIGTKGIVLNHTDGDGDTGVYYHPWLTTDAVPVTEEQVEDVLFGVKFQAQGGVTFANGHKFFNKLLATVGGSYVWKNHTIRFLMGGSYNGQTLPYSQYNVITTMLVNDWAANQLVASFQLKAQTKQLDKAIPVTPYFESEYPNLGAGVRGTHKWIGYGRATMKPDLTDASGLGVYTVADADYQTLFAVHAVYAVEKITGVRTLLTLTTDYTVDLTACTVTVVGAIYTHDDYDLEVDVTGKPDGGGSYLQTIGEIAQDILTTFLLVPLGQIDTAAFAQADVDDQTELSVWLKSPRQIASIFSGAGEDQPCLEKSALATITQTTAGLWTCRVFDPIVNATDPDVITMRQSDFGVFEPQPKVESMFGLTRVFFNRNHYAADYAVTEFVDDRTGYLNGVTDTPAKIYTFIRSETDAQRLAQRYQLISGSASTSVTFTERGLKLIKARAGQKVLLSYDPAPSATGSWMEEPFEITALSKVSGPVPGTSGEMGDLKGIGNRVGRWMDSSAPDYATATAAQRIAGGFWADSTGYIVPGDATTRNIRIWY